MLMIAALRADWMIADAVAESIGCMQGFTITGRNWMRCRMPRLRMRGGVPIGPSMLPPFWTPFRGYAPRVSHQILGLCTMPFGQTDTIDL